MADINDVFEQILLSEERIADEAYKQGFDKSVSEGNLEAYHLGKQKPHQKTAATILRSFFHCNRISSWC